VIFVFVNSGKSKSPDANVPESCHSKSDDEQEEILGSDDDEQEAPDDYCKGKNCLNKRLSYYRGTTQH